MDSYSSLMGGSVSSASSSSKNSSTFSTVSSSSPDRSGACSERGVKSDAAVSASVVSVFSGAEASGFDEIIAEAEKKDIQVGWSNPCFEIWMYAYFGVMPAIQDSWTCCSEFGRVYESKTGQKYSKADEKMYEKICCVGNEEKAIHIAQQKLEQREREGKTKPSEMCPGTTVHRLVGVIRGKANG